MITDTFIYDPEEALFYSLPSEVGRKMFSGGNVASPAAPTARTACSPFEFVKSSKPLLCFTTDDDLDEGGCGQENWQRLHPSCWSNSDVLDVIFYVASKSSHGLDAVHNLRGEKFQGLSGSDLYRMTRQDFRERDSVYGGLLFDCIRELLTKSEFLPPAGMSPTSFELNNLELFKDKEEDFSTDLLDEQCELQRQLSLPKPVQELMDAEGDDEPPLNLVSSAGVPPSRNDCPTCRHERGGRGDDDCPCVEIYGHEYSIDNAADFSNILQPSLVIGNDVVLGNECYVYTDLTSAKPRYSASNGIDYSLYSRPIDLSTGPMYRRSSQRGDMPALTAIAPVMGVPQRLYQGQALETCVHGGGAMPKASRRTQKKPPAAADGQHPHAKRTGKTNTSKTASGGSNGRHLWEFIRDLLKNGDDGNREAAEIIRWENRTDGIFRIIDSKKVAQQWGARKRNKTMTYEKLSRALRWSRTYGFLSNVPKDGSYPKKLCFRFGDLANWRD